jgi:hypothetical protein
MVALTGSRAAPDVVDRRRIELIDATDEASRFVYHQASELPLPAATQLVETSIRTALDTTLVALRSALVNLNERGFVIHRAGMVGLAPTNLGALAGILASHAAIHTAEGELYRTAIVAACEMLGIAVDRMAANSLRDDAPRAIGLTVAVMDDHMALVKRRLGPPWGQDQKAAMTAAWTALAAAPTTKFQSPSRRKRR